MQSTSPIWKWLWNEGGKNLPPSEYEGDIVSFDNPGYTYPKDITIGIEPVQSGSGDPSPTNVRPISGWTGANVTRCGKNLFDESIAVTPYFDNVDGTFTNKITDTRSPAMIRVQAFNGSTLVTYAITSGAYPNRTIATITINSSVTRLVIKHNGASRDLTIQIPWTAQGTFAISCLVPSNDPTTVGGLVIKDIQVEEGSTATPYAPYTGTTYPISWQSVAGTVYGGTLDVTTGLLTVTMAEVDLGTLNYSEYGSSDTVTQYYTPDLDVLAKNYSRIVSDVFVYSASLAPWTGKITNPNGKTYLRTPKDQYSSPANFKAAMSGVQLVYELATPQTYKLTPTEVKLLLGENNVWADTGDMTVALVSAGYTRLEARATVGGTVYTDIGVPVINRATMQDRLAVGNVVSASLALALRSAGSVPRSAAVVIETRLTDGETASEWLPQGTFYVSRRMRDPVTGLLALECYDALLKANAVWTPSAGAWPRTLAAVTAELAALLGVALDGRTVIPTGAAYAMSEPAEGTTIRDALSIIAQAAGGNWIITPAGKLRLVRLGEDGDAVEVAGVVGGIDVGQAGTITGVRSTVDGVVTLTGDDTGIVVDVTVAPMIAAELAEDLIGLSYQPFSLAGAIYDPATELGDGIRAGVSGEVASALCSEQAVYGPAFRGDIAAPDPGEVTDEYPYISKNESAISLLKARVQELSDTAVAGTTILYASGASATDPPAEGWSTTPPEHVDGRYVWQKVVTLYADGRSETSEAVNITGADGEDATVLRIDSSRGTVFKNNQVSTVLSVAIYHGPDRITDTTALARAFGVGAYLQWSWQRMGEDRYGIISSDDSRIGDGGFTFTLSPADVDTKVTFMCELIVNQ